jgi:hypothetical protein
MASGNAKRNAEEVGTERAVRIVLVPLATENQEHFMRHILDVSDSNP